MNEEMQPLDVKVLKPEEGMSITLNGFKPITAKQELNELRQLYHHRFKGKHGCTNCKCEKVYKRPEISKYEGNLGNYILF